MLEYDGMGWKETDEDLVSPFSHEMIYSFSLMNPETDGYDNGWYIEGEPDILWIVRKVI